ncbi:MAG: protoheme IX farnesyltransferase [Planctomycetota bacterium]|jgi:protoheme IX farnesyltransferase
MSTRELDTTIDPGVMTWQDWITLTKPRIASFILFAAFVGAMLAAGDANAWANALEVGIYVTCLGAGASAFNQVIERDVDSLMVRTCNRPLPAGRISPAAAIAFATTLALAGAIGLALRFGLLSSLLGIGTLCAYTLVYTPLKRLSLINTLVGAVPGGMPPLIGYAALSTAENPVGGWGIALFAVIFAWQFPHFMAIAWLHREDYARAGMRMLPAVVNSEGLAGRQAVCYSLVLLPVSLVPLLRGDAGEVYGIGVFVLGLVYIAASVAFGFKENTKRAKTLLYVSLVYLPALLLLALLDPATGPFAS